MNYSELKEINRELESTVDWLKESNDNLKHALGQILYSHDRTIGLQSVSTKAFDEGKIVFDELEGK